MMQIVWLMGKHNVLRVTMATIYQTMFATINTATATMEIELLELVVPQTDLTDVQVAVPATIYRHHLLIIINVGTNTATATMDQELLEVVVQQTVIINVFHVLVVTIYQIIVVTIKIAIVIMVTELLDPVVHRMEIIAVRVVMRLTTSPTTNVTKDQNIRISMTLD